MNEKISLVVCTYNRDEILPICLESLSKQSVSSNSFEIIVIDNNSTDKTSSIVKHYVERFDNFNYYIEAEMGLCNARNKGLALAKADWVGYIDDDVKLDTNFIENILKTINSEEFDVFGGCYHPWFYFGKPRWFPKDFETNWNKETKIGLLTNNDDVWGAAMFFKKAILQSINGFPTNLDMTGNKIAYGGDTYAINLLKEKGFKIGINPNIVIHHLVGKHKLKFSWHFKSSFAKARDGYIANYINEKDRPTLLHSLYLLIRLLITSFIRAIYYLITKKDFYLQNGIYHIGIPFCHYIGTIYAILKNKLPNNFLVVA
jgi:glycosyltransferase involved in cell wall biosynthesis